MKPWAANALLRLAWRRRPATAARVGAERSTHFQRPPAQPDQRLHPVDLILLQLSPQLAEDPQVKRLGHLIDTCFQQTHVGQ